MVEDELNDILDAVLVPLGCKIEPGTDYDDPPLDIRRYARRSVKLHWLPLLGRGLSVTAVVRQPPDLAFSPSGLSQFVRRTAEAVNGRFPPRMGLTVGLTIVMLTSDPIQPADDQLLASAARPLPRLRVVPVAVIRLNMAQELMAMALTATPGDLFPEGLRLAEALEPRMRRFLPLLSFDGSV